MKAPELEIDHVGLKKDKGKVIEEADEIDNEQED